MIKMNKKDGKNRARGTIHDLRSIPLAKKKACTTLIREKKTCSENYPSTHPPRP